MVVSQNVLLVYVFDDCLQDKFDEEIVCLEARIQMINMDVLNTPDRLKAEIEKLSAQLNDLNTELKSIRYIFMISNSTNGLIWLRIRKDD